jgi:glucokinase
MRSLVLAADIGATKTMVAVLPADGRLGDASPVRRFETPRDPVAAIGLIVVAAHRLVADTGGRLRAAGVVAPGPLDPTTGRIGFSPNLGWRDVPLGAWTADRLGVPVAVDDDATAAALGEAHVGAGRGADPFVYLTVSSGIGAGIVVGGRTLRGAHGIAGEVGHLVIDPSGPRCGCGRRGDIESFAGGASLARQARRIWARVRLDDGSPAPRDAAGIFRAARADLPEAVVLAEAAAEATGRAIAALAAVVDPACIALGGSVALGQPWLRRRATTVARQRAMAETGRVLRVVSAELGDRSCLAGAAVLAVARLSET